MAKTPNDTEAIAPPMVAAVIVEEGLFMLGFLNLTVGGILLYQLLAYESGYWKSRPLFFVLCALLCGTNFACAYWNFSQ